MTAAGPDDPGGVLAVSVGVARDVEWAGRWWRTAIFKAPVPGAAWLRHDGVDGDEQANPRVHGGPDKAVYAYARTDLDWWRPLLGRPLDAGAFGENLTLAGVDPAGARVGERWRVGGALLEVAGPRIPCAKLGLLRPFGCRVT
ncbi:MAG: MOSC domain-containing protein, partial [Actinomycetota bacterium]|nr:MOSC domain-containing protein [Actinomycetota bacterium]